MSPNQLVKNSDFKEVAQVKADSKHRIALGKTLTFSKTNMYKVYQNEYGQIILDPQVTIPAHEAWLFKNKKVLEHVRTGLEDAKKGRVVPAKEDYSKYID